MSFVIYKIKDLANKNRSIIIFKIIWLLPKIERYN